MNETINQLLERKSVRVFTDEEITIEEKRQILDATVNAPSAGNMQLYSIIDVTDQQLKEQLSVLCDNQPFIKEAKMVWIFCADYQKWYNGFTQLGLSPRHPGAGDLLLCTADACIAAQNAVTAAWSLGIGSCYIGDIMENFEKINELFDLPELVYPAAMLVFGKPTTQQLERKKPQRVDNKYVLFENKYQQFDSQQTRDMLSYKSLVKSYEQYMEGFMNFKNNSDFSKEMSRSADLYIKKFKGEL